MKKLLLTAFLMSLLTLGLSSQSWAFGSRSHGPNGNNDFSPNHSSDTNNINNNNTNDPTGNNTNSNTPNNNFPAAPVPEPMTLSLLGMGAAGMLLKKKMGR